MGPQSSRNAAYLIALLLPAALMAAVLVAQYGFGLPPCEMCWWQRYGHIAGIVLALGAWGLRGRGNGSAGDPLVVLAASAIAVSGLIGAFHAGVEYHWWQGFTTCSSSRLGGGDPLAAIMNAPLIRCDVAAWTLFGVSLAGYNFLVSLPGAALIVALLGRARGATPQGHLA
ncbi:disulfide bond formation protein B [Novosphingobium lentum]|uniref:disulfide bond formation protein B n=1 Tax=Novosphingobium lentum TaxID=145287 RepID=UPI00083678FD|nr:disulfide bond formation protein B [Novosphingobium lentum]